MSLNHSSRFKPPLTSEKLFDIIFLSASRPLLFTATVIWRQKLCQPRLASAFAAREAWPKVADAANIRKAIARMR
jgi:hypothetical protein